MSKITIYEHASYKGRSQSLGVGRYNIRQLGIGNDTLSSLRIPAGFRVTLFEHNFTGRSKVLTGDTYYVGNDFNDKTSSIVVEKSGHEGSATPHPTGPEQYNRWMERHYQQIKNKKLSQVCLPGTHDSGTYYLRRELAPDIEDVVKTLWKFRTGGAIGLEDHIHAMSVTQEKTFYEQLSRGIRYIDLRVCWHKNDFHTCHGLAGNPIRTLLNDMKRFLDENKKELILVKVGFKELNTSQERQAKRLFKDVLGSHYVDKNSAAIYGETIEGLLGKERAIFINDEHNFETNYSSNANTNRDVLNRLKELAPKRGKLLEAQLFCPVSMKDYVLSYLQKHGCKLLPVIMPLLALPLVGPILAAVGIASATSFITFLKNCSPLPTSLHQKARNSRSIIKDYFNWLSGRSGPTPNLIICDFFEEVPLVDIAIRLSTGSSYTDLLRGIRDVPLPSVSFPNALESIFLCGIDALAAAAKMAKYACEQAANFIKENVADPSAKAMATALKGAGYGVTEVGKVVSHMYHLGPEALKSVLSAAGYVGNEIKGCFESMGGAFADSFKDIGNGIKDGVEDVVRKVFSGW